MLWDSAVISWDEALCLVRNTSRYDHVLMVSAIMEKLARKLGESVQEWGLVGLLHDLDYDEIGGDMSRHGVVAAEKLKGKLPEHCLYAIKAHDYRTGFKPRSRFDKILIAVDTVTIVIEKSRKTVKQIDAAVLLEEVERASIRQPGVKKNVLICEEIGLELGEFLELCLGTTRKADDIADF